MAEIGRSLLILGLISSVVAIYAFISEGRNHSNQRIHRLANLSLYLSCSLISLAVLTLYISIFSHQFQIDYVASYTSSDMSVPYLIASLWAGNAGSLLFLAWVLAILGVIFHRRRNRIGSDLSPYATAFVMFTLAFFVLLLVTVASPFEKLAVAPLEGQGMNPLLENPGMIFHPPTLLAGYVALTIPFALAFSALLSGKLGEDWLYHTREWALIAWLLLGIGNIIGAWWAYVELGWGGYWAWDPVENAGLMPWLIITAFLHSIMIQKRRHLLKRWNLVLVILAFNLAMLGSFITRSGILSSVHTFGKTGLEPFFIVFLNLIFWIPWILMYLRRDKLIDEDSVKTVISREGTFQLNNILMLGGTLVVLIGTIFPSITELFTGRTIEVGEQFFNSVMGPVFLVMLVLLGLCSIIGWQRRISWSSFFRKIIMALIPAILIVIVLAVLGNTEWYAIVSFAFCGFTLSLILFEWLKELVLFRRKGNGGLKAFFGLLRTNRVRYGAYIVHVAVVLIVVGVVGSSFYEVEQEAYLQPGENVQVGDYTLVFQGLSQDETPSRDIVTAEVDVYRDGKFLATMRPEKIFHHSFEQPVSEVAIRSNAIEDLYVILGGWEADGTGIFRVLVNPLVVWIWIGGVLVAIGGLLAFWPKKGSVIPPVSRDDRDVNLIDDEIEERVRQLRSNMAVCPRCGNKVGKDDYFCAYCGARLKQGSDQE